MTTVTRKFLWRGRKEEEERRGEGRVGVRRGGRGGRKERSGVTFKIEFLTRC